MQKKLVNKIIDDDFDIFLENRVENDNEMDMDEIFGEKAFNEERNDMPQQLNNASPDIDNNFGPFDQAANFETNSQHSEVEFSVGNELSSIMQNDQLQSPSNPLQNSRVKYEIDTNSISFLPGGDGIFKETSFINLETQGDSTSYLSSSYNHARTILNRIKKIENDKSEKKSKNQGEKETKATESSEVPRISKPVVNALDILSGKFFKNIPIFRKVTRQFNENMILTEENFEDLRLNESLAIRSISTTEHSLRSRYLRMKIPRYDFKVRKVQIQNNDSHFSPVEYGDEVNDLEQQEYHMSDHLNMTQLPDAYTQNYDETTQRPPQFGSKLQSTLFAKNHNINLKKMKSKISSQLSCTNANSRTTFSDVFKSIQATMPSATVETVFICTLHHLNEKDIEIDQLDDLDFMILK